MDLDFIKMQLTFVTFILSLWVIGSNGQQPKKMELMLQDFMQEYLSKSVVIHSNINSLQTSYFDYFKSKTFTG